MVDLSNFLRGGAAAKPDSALPRHVAIVMDGNGRWAKKRFMPRIFGHKFGMEALVRVIDDCHRRGIQYLTVYAFSSENWKRPDEEVSGLMNLVLVGVSKYLARLADKGVRIHVAGDRSKVSERVCQAWHHAETTTAGNTGLELTVAFNYGGRWDIVQACKRAIADGLAPEALSEEALSKYMALGYAPDPDLFIRTGGEVRISNFLLWQLAYAELHFTDCLWPDFDEAELDKAIAVFASRDRRFGGVKPSPSTQEASA
ncbi:di-trans,poly-cis-decaprenylcistransferase [Ideonella azotifigens]|uniref:Isoprenyl transferase n=1 Tax=Ideonella azotifigens TaxID=513160 RepID=A0ABP3VCR3_9BURK|nr:polyprenyl diphosphate synthase [Ideonella azotifigens]MCD2343937.1 di-trans,poly-cis-decaprenylcistransferase [Ideonella azotifigens]